MCCVRKLIHRPDMFHLISALRQHLKISRQCRRITAHINNAFRLHQKHCL